MKDEKLLTVHEVAVAYRLSDQTVRRLINDGQLRVQRLYLPGRKTPRIRIPESALVEVEWSAEQSA